MAAGDDVVGALGCLLALPADGMTSAAGATNFAEIGFAFRISGTSLVVGMVLAGLVGVAGGVLPAFRAARMPITSALRDAYCKTGKAPRGAFSPSSSHSSSSRGTKRVGGRGASR